MPPRDTIVSVAVLLACAAALVVGTVLFATGHVAPNILP